VQQGGGETVPVAQGLKAPQDLVDVRRHRCRAAMQVVQGPARVTGRRQALREHARHVVQTQVDEGEAQVQAAVGLGQGLVRPALRQVEQVAGRQGPGLRRVEGRAFGRPRCLGRGPAGAGPGRRVHLPALAAGEVQHEHVVGVVVTREARAPGRR
jgi:hypothetical protein